MLTFEAQPGDPAFDAAASRSHTSGFEIQSSYASAFDLDVSGDGKAWRTVHHTDAGTGGVVTIPLSRPSPRAGSGSPRRAARRRTRLGLNGFQVFGTGPRDRPAVHGWTSFPVRPHDDPPALAVAADGTVPLESGWVLTMDDWAPTGDGAALSGSAVDTRGWLPATVPGTVLASLVEQGRLPDPVSGLNTLHVPEALSRHAWWYRRRFALPRGLDTSAGRHVWLEFDGVNHEARIWLNGAEIGTQSHPFGRGAYDVTAALHRIRRPGPRREDLADAAARQPGRQGRRRQLLGRRGWHDVRQLADLPRGVRLGLDARGPRPRVRHLGPRPPPLDRRRCARRRPRRHEGAGRGHRRRDVHRAGAQRRRDGPARQGHRRLRAGERLQHGHRPGRADRRRRVPGAAGEEPEAVVAQRLRRPEPLRPDAHRRDRRARSATGGRRRSACARSATSTTSRS